MEEGNNTKIVERDNQIIKIFLEHSLQCSNFAILRSVLNRTDDQVFGGKKAHMFKILQNVHHKVFEASKTFWQRIQAREETKDYFECLYHYIASQTELEIRFFCIEYPILEVLIDSKMRTLQEEVEQKEIELEMLKSYGNRRAISAQPEEETADEEQTVVEDEEPLEDEQTADDEEPVEEDVAEDLEDENINTEWSPYLKSFESVWSVVQTTFFEPHDE